MSAPKLYLILIHNNVVDQITTYRELDDVLKAWGALEICDKIGILHCGFIRPIVPEDLELPELVNGKMIYTGALKWALPDYFNSSSDPVVYITLNDQLTPCYLALNQWGYEITDEKELDKELRPQNLPAQNKADHKDTISLAAQQVLNDANNLPLNKEEIYALIIESDYYQFNTPKPVHVLDVTLNRETIGTEYSKAAKIPVYGKTNENRYFLLGDKAVGPKGWVHTLSTKNPDLYEKLHEFGIADEDGFIAIRQRLPVELCAVIDNERFLLLQTSINQHDPHEILQIAPQWMLERHIAGLGFTVRIENALLGAGISKMSELAELTIDDLKRLPNMGKRSIDDICNAIFFKISTLTDDFHNSSNSNMPINEVNSQNSPEIDSTYLANQVSLLPLRQHLDRTLDELDEVDRLILHGRLGYKGKVLTLEEIAKKLDVTRERIRQRQKKYVDKIIAKEHWDDVIGIRIGQLLLDRAEPIILEMLEIEDPWFEGFMDDGYVYLANVIQMFSENAIRVIEAQGRNVVTRINQKDWDSLLKNIKNNLRHKAEQKIWTRTDVELSYESNLAEFSAKELLPLLKEAVDEFLQFDGTVMNSVLIAYGRSAESAVAAVLAQAEGPLHFSEIASRATEILGRVVDDRRAHNAVAAKGVWLFDRGTYGLLDHCPLPESKRNSIRQIVEHLLYQGEINKQWHSKEIIEQLKQDFPAIPDELDPYVLRMCIEESEKINFLNRMVWARSDSGLNSEDRVEVTDAFIQILEEAGEPLSGRELKSRLSNIRGVDESMQIHPNERLVAVGPNTWGLSEWK